MNNVKPNDDVLNDSSAIPSIDASSKDLESLGVPLTVAKSKTNINKAGIYVLITVFTLMTVMMLIFFAKRSISPKDEAKEKAPAAFTVNNKEVDSQTIKQKQAAIRKALALEKTIEDARLLEEKNQVEAKKQAEAVAVATALASSQNTAATGQNQAPISTSSTGQSNVPARVHVETAFERKMKGDVLVDVDDKNNSEVLSLNKGLANNNPNSNGFVNTNTSATQANPNNAIANSLQPTVLASRKAGTLGNLDYLLLKNTSIPCALKTGIDTTLAGFVDCKVLNDVYSSNGHTLLVERGADISGEQQSSLKQGQARTFVLWTRIVSPSGIYADLDSPATDALGYNGIEGFVDSHFWARFGGAIMISFIKDFSQILVNNSSPRNNQSVSFENSQKTSESLATETLRNSINIPPTLVVSPATVVNVLLARDVSFENVYTVER